jgi:hypothetical protein
MEISTSLRAASDQTTSRLNMLLDQAYQATLQQLQQDTPAVRPLTFAKVDKVSIAMDAPFHTLRTALDRISAPARAL